MEHTYEIEEKTILRKNIEAIIGIESLNKLFQSHTSNFESLVKWSDSTERLRGTQIQMDKSAKLSCLSNLESVRKLSQFYAL